MFTQTHTFTKKSIQEAHTNSIQVRLCKVNWSVFM